MCRLYAIYNHYKELETDDNEFYLSKEWSTWMNHNLKDGLEQALTYIKVQSNGQTHMKMRSNQFDNILFMNYSHRQTQLYFCNCIASP